MRPAFATSNLNFSDLQEYEPVSSDSKTVSRRWAEERNVLRDSASHWAPIVNPAFREIRQSCNAANWDGAGSSPITQRVIAIAGLVVEALFSMLSKGTPAPDVIPEADGEICLSWSTSPDRAFSISIGERGKMNFAGQFGRQGGVHGWRPIETSNRNALERSLREVADHIEKVHTPAAEQRAA